MSRRNWVRVLALPVLALALGAVLIVALPLKALFALLFAASAVFSAGFALRLGRPWHNPDPIMAWLQAAIAWIAVAWDLAWTALTLAIVVPVWVFALLLLAQDGIFGWRWWVLESTRHRDRHSITAS